MKFPAESKGWWIFIFIGLIANLVLPSNSKASTAGLFLIYTGFYDLLGRMINKWAALLVCLFIIAAYTSFINLLAGGV